MTLSKMAVEKPTTVLIIFAVLTALGIYSTTQLPIDLLPDMEMPYIAISTTYTNAGPEEVERSVTRPLESAVSSVTGLDTMQSISSSGSSLITCRPLRKLYRLHLRLRLLIVITNLGDRHARRDFA